MTRHDPAPTAPARARMIVLLMRASFLPWCLLAFSLQAQTFEVRAAAAFDMAENKSVRMGNGASVNGHILYSMDDSLPMSVFVAWDLGVLGSFSEPVGHTSGNRDTTLQLSRLFHRAYIGIKLADRRTMDRITPFFSAMVGNGWLTTRSSLSSRDPDVQEASDKKYLSERLSLSQGMIYKLEAGAELKTRNRNATSDDGKRKMRIAYFLSSSIIGSFRPFEYHNIGNLSTPLIPTMDASTINEEVIAQAVQDNAELRRDRLFIWSFSLGMVLLF